MAHRFVYFYLILEGTYRAIEAAASAIVWPPCNVLPNSV